MKLTGELKKQVEKTDNMDEKKRLIEEAGMELSYDELDQVAGGKGFINNNATFTIGGHTYNEGTTVRIH